MNQPIWRDIQDTAKERDDVIYRLGIDTARGLNVTALKVAKDNLGVILNDKIKHLLSQQRKEIIEDVEKTVQKELETWARESIGAKAVESVQKALADIITKLSKPEV